MGNILVGVTIFLVVLAFSIFVRHYFRYVFFGKIKFLAKSSERLAAGVFFLMVIIGLHLGFIAADADPQLILMVKAIEIMICTWFLFAASNAMADYSANLWEKTEVYKNRIKFIYLFNLLTKTAVGILAFDLLLGLWSIDLFTVGYDVIDIIEQNNFTKAIILFIVYLVIARLVLYLCKTYFTEIVSETKTKYDDIILEKSEYSISWLIICYGLKTTLKTIGYEGTIITVINTTIVVIVAITLVVIIDSVIRYFKYKSKSAINEESIQVLANFIKIITFVVGLFTILVIWGIEIKSLLVSLGVLSVVVGFALRSTLDNIVSGISLMLDQSFSVGDIVKLGENDNSLSDGMLGEVEQIGLRSTKIRTFDNQYMIIPNSELAAKTIINYAKPDPKIRIVIPVAVAYGSKTDKVEKVLRDCLKGFKEIIDKEKVQTRLMKLDDFSLNYELVFYISDYREMIHMISKITSKIYNALRENKIEIPFPTRTVYMKERK